MKNRKLKKGFTLVELIVVIAIIAILAAVSVVSYLAFIRQANESADIQLVKQLNTALQGDQILNGPRSTMHEMLGAMEDNGFVVENLTKTKSGYDIVWDQENNRFGLLDKDKVVYGEDSFKITDSNKYNFWKFADTFDEANENKYSIYLTKDFKTEKTSLTVYAGLDVGDYAGLSQINYENNKPDAQEQKVLFNTNNIFSTLTIDAIKDEVAHYGDVGDLNIIAVKKGSYNEYGRVGGVATLTYGRINVQNDAEITTIYANPANEADVELTIDSKGVVSTLLSNNEDVITSLFGGNEEKINYTELIGEDQVDEITTSVAYILNANNTRTYYDSFDEACNKASDNDTIVVMRDYQYSSQLKNTLVEVAANKSITLDLNGKIIQAILDNSKSITMFSVKGNLTVKDSTAGDSTIGTGSIETSVAYTVDPWNVSAAVIKSLDGGTFTLESGKLINRGGKGSYVIDVYNGSTTNINGGYIEASQYVGIRMFCNSVSKAASVNITGGKFESYFDNLWVHNPNGNANLAKLNISDGSFNCVSDNSYEIDVSFEYGNCYNYTGMEVNVSGGRFKKGIYLEYDFWNNSNGNAGTFNIVESLSSFVTYGTEDWKTPNNNA